ncbi:HTH-type transcriptional regulator LutR [bacterium HR40]|nr:HTH-type transcriptional regulator LutR [bacterium HR40]
MSTGSDLFAKLQTPVRRRKLADEVEARLLALIREGGLRPGDPLPSEREIMTSCGVGRPAVREAMQRLERMGLVEIRHGERARVACPSIARTIRQVGETVRHLLAHSPASLEHLKEARATFEKETARIAAERRTPAKVARLRELLAEQEAARLEPERFTALDGLLHREIAAISGNPIFPAVVEAVFGWLSRYHLRLVRVRGAEFLTLAEHRAIVEAIAAGDGEAAAAAMQAHLLRANALYRHFEEAAEEEDA